MAEIRKIPLSQLEVDPDNPRQERDQDADDDLRESFKRDGQLNPIRVVPLSSEKFRVSAGTRRYEQAKALGWTELLCQVVETDEETLKKEKLLDNLQRINPSEIDTAIYATELMASYGWSRKRLARELRVDQAAISRWCTIAEKLTPALRSSKLPGRILYLLASKVKDPAEQLALAKRVKDENLTVEQLAAILSGQKPKAKKTVFKVKGAKVTVEGPSTVQEALAEALAQAKRS
jgi:ParB family chromosome partitioning protein